ncbi:MAG: hydantoinase/oxoprolinase family protein [Bacillota bacterium]
MRFMIGVDVGGTFTDLTLVDVAAQVVHTHKVRSTPADPSRAIMTGIVELVEMTQIPYDAVDYLAHGTTVATNALIEKKGVATGLLTTEGFRDLLEIGRQTRPALYNPQLQKPEPLVPAHLRLEVPERIYASGEVRQPLDPGAVQAAVEQLKAAGVKAVAICFLFSYVNPEHETATAELVQELFPEAYVSVSHQVVPEFREFSRLSTTVLNAYVGPVMQRYLRNFQNSVREVGIKVDPYITQSNGGILSIEETVRNPVRTAVSGPSAGVVAAAHLGRLAGIRNMITFDMGGTSADISVIYQGEPLLSNEREVEGWPARIPMLDIITIGAGGGSIAHIDAGGALKVGPESAGAQPGPACYPGGGSEPTVTDANVVLGRMNPGKILGGRMELNAEAARQAVNSRVAERSGLDTLTAASGIIDVVNANMVRAIRLVSVERGYDPREFTLVAFGGAGPLHAVALAQELDIPQVLVPPSPGTLCSLGLLVTDIRADHVVSKVLVPSQESLPTIQQIFAKLSAEGRALLEKEQVPAERRRYILTVDARYQRQNYELPINVEEGELTPAGLADLLSRFHAEHARAYGYARPQAPVEFVNFRLTAVGELPKAPIAEYSPRTGGKPLPLGERKVYFKEANAYVNCPVYQRDAIQPGDELVGPAIVEQMDTTVVVPPGMRFHADTFGNLLIDVKGGDHRGE